MFFIKRSALTGPSRGRLLLAGLLTFLLTACAGTGSPSRDATGTGKIPAVQAQLFFYYGCIHCNNFYFDQLKAYREQHPEVEVKEVAIAVFQFQHPAAKAFYAAELAGINPAFHEAAYNAHRADSLMRPDAAYFANLAETCCNLPKERFLTLYNSTEVEAKFQEAQGLKELLQINAVPAVIHQGQRTTLEQLVP